MISHLPDMMVHHILSSVHVDDYRSIAPVSKRVKGIIDADNGLFLSLLPSNVLRTAISKGLTDKVEMLISRGCKPEPYALSDAASMGHIEIVRILMATGAAPNKHTLISPAQSGHTEVVRLLLAAPGLVDSIRGQDTEALTVAAAGNHIEIVRMLLSAGVNVQARDNQAYLYAAMFRHIQVVRLLEAAGAQLPTLAFGM